MLLSIFNLFNIGIGPSSSHTVGPMRASNFFIKKLKGHKQFDQTEKVKVELYGSLSLTGVGHGTDKALIAGLSGEIPEKAEPKDIEIIFNNVKNLNPTGPNLNFNKEKMIEFNYQKDLVFNYKTLPFHPNGMIYNAIDKNGKTIYKKTFYSIGGGFIVGQKMAKQDQMITNTKIINIPYPFETAKELISYALQSNKPISEITLDNERTLRTDKRIDEKIKLIWKVMSGSIDAGLTSEGNLPGRLNVKRRAKELNEKLAKSSLQNMKDPLTIMDYVSLYALAVNEENAAGGRVVTAPTNGAAGIVPAVLKYHEEFGRHQGFSDVKRYLLTAGTIGILYKKNASISGAEVGCQGEVGVACSMAAAGLCELMGGTPEQVENAAEIAMEHNLGLTCDPIDGQVQIPCIERNAMAAIKAISAARMAIKGTGKHYISLDQVIKTMKQTGLDMQSKYKETAQGGLAATVNITEC